MNEVVLRPIGTVTAEDDFWGGEVSVIELDSEQFSEDVIMRLSELMKKYYDIKEEQQ